MTSFINVKYSAHHDGADRVIAAMDAAEQARRDLAGTRGLALLLLSAIASAAMVVAYEAMDSMTQVHLLVMWIALWAVAFGVLALFTGAASRIAIRTKSSLDAWSRSVAEARADQRRWAMANNEYRLMADPDAAIPEVDARVEVAQESPAAPLTPSLRAEQAVWHGSRGLRDPYSSCF